MTVKSNWLLVLPNMHLFPTCLKALVPKIQFKIQYYNEYKNNKNFTVFNLQFLNVSFLARFDDLEQHQTSVATNFIGMINIFNNLYRCKIIWFRKLLLIVQNLYKMLKICTLVVLSISLFISLIIVLSFLPMHYNRRIQPKHVNESTFHQNVTFKVSSFENKIKIIKQFNHSKTFNYLNFSNLGIIHLFCFR